MSKNFLSFQKSILIALFLMSVAKSYAQSSQRWEYIQRYKEIAAEEMQRAGIPASIKLAQGLLESGAGTSTLAKKANNHFGMKCGAEWQGEGYMLKDDDYDEEGNLKESCFRVYKSPEESYRAHSEFLRDPNKAYRYGFLFRLSPTDYEGWAKGLKQAGYATSPTYADALISIIRQYKLNELDACPSCSALADVILVNDVKMVMAKNNQTPADIAQAHKVSLKRLMRYNEGLTSANQQLKNTDRVFLQKKRRFFRGSQREYGVRQTDDMYSISQQFGIRMKSLLRKNKMKEGQEAAAGERLHLRGLPFFRKSPKLREKNEREQGNTPFDEGTGKVPHIDETNQVDPNDLPTQGNMNSGNNNNGNNSNNNQNNGTNTNPNSSNNSSNSNNGENGNNNNGSNVNNNPNNNSNNNSQSNTTNKPTTTNGSNNNGNNGNVITTPTNPNNGGNSGGNTTTTKPNTGNSTSTSGSTSTTTKPTTGSTSGSTTNGTTTKPNTGSSSTTSGSTGTVKPTTPKPETPQSGVQYHTVEKGETLYSIAKRYGLTVDGLKKLNDLIDNNIKLGQKLRLN